MCVTQCAICIDPEVYSTHICTQYCIMLRSVGPIFMGREVAATVSLSPFLSLRLDTLSTAAID